MKAFKIVLLTLVSLLLVACGGDGPEKVAENFAEAIVEGDVDKMLELIYIPEEIRKEMDSDPEAAKMMEDKLGMMFGMVAAEVKKQGGVDKIKAGKVTYNADKTEATVSVDIKMKNGDNSGGEPMQLIKTDDGWKISLD